MNNFSFNREGREMRLLPGFRFEPTDQELVFQYLKRKVFSSPLPASIIPEINISNIDPWDLPGDFEEERYYFCKKEAKYKNRSRTNRATVSGYWKATGSDKRIVSSRSNEETIGMKKTLVFYEGKPSNGCKTQWIMHEYRLQTNPNYQDFSNQLRNWVICSVFMKKTRNAENEENESFFNNNSKVEPNFFIFPTRDNSNINISPAFSASSSSNSSDITLNSSGSDHQNETTSCNFF